MYEVGRCLLRYRLKEARMSQQELSEKIKMSKTQISDYIHNRRKMSLSTAKTIAEAVGCTIDDLYEWKKVR